MIFPKLRFISESRLFVDAGKAKARFFSLPQEWDDKLAKAIAESGMSENEWLEQTIIEKLKA